MKFTINALSEPAECVSFLKIKDGSTNYAIDEYIKLHAHDSETTIKSCRIVYRGREMSYGDMIDEHNNFSEQLLFFSNKLLNPHSLADILAYKMPGSSEAVYFAQKAGDCLQFGRYFTMKCHEILDTDYNLNWATGYQSQYYFRCIYFSTAPIWYSNTFDHILQIVYWGMGLFTSTTDREGNTYDSSWNVKKTLSLCTYDFVVGELKKRNLMDLRSYLTRCSTNTKEVRFWANFIKHKGGFDFKFLHEKEPFQVFMAPVNDDTARPEYKVGDKFIPMDDRYMLEDYKSPVEIDIDDKVHVLQESHGALLECLNAVAQMAIVDNKQVQETHKEEPTNG